MLRVFFCSLHEYWEELILFATMCVLIYQNLQTRKLVRLEASRDQPFLELALKEDEKTCLFLTNFGKSPAYSPTVSIDMGQECEETWDVDPLEIGKNPIQPQEERKIWVHNRDKELKSKVESISAFRDYLIRNNRSAKITLTYCDKEGEKLVRTLFAKVGGGTIRPRDIYITTEGALGLNLKNP